MSWKDACAPTTAPHVGVATNSSCCSRLATRPRWRRSPTASAPTSSTAARPLRRTRHGHHRRLPGGTEARPSAWCCSTPTMRSIVPERRAQPGRDRRPLSSERPTPPGRRRCARDGQPPRHRLPQRWQRPAMPSPPESARSVSAIHCAMASASRSVAARKALATARIGRRGRLRHTTGEALGDDRGAAHRQQGEASQETSLAAFARGEGLLELVKLVPAAGTRPLAGTERALQHESEHGGRWSGPAVVGIGAATPSPGHRDNASSSSAARGARTPPPARARARGRARRARRCRDRRSPPHAWTLGEHLAGGSTAARSRYTRTGAAGRGGSRDDVAAFLSPFGSSVAPRKALVARLTGPGAEDGRARSAGAAARRRAPRPGGRSVAARELTEQDIELRQRALDEVVPCGGGAGAQTRGRLIDADDQAAQLGNGGHGFGRAALGFPSTG